ncbi:MAG: DUF3644 domain-containing protein [Spirochaetaceae bacterium]|nr:DUF3644 domain-containing protein [Spirochaetaceae bacterium]
MAISDRDFDLKKGLIEKSIEAYVLALETINRLTIRYRLETFCYLVCNAWELLLKAKIIDRENDSDSIFYRKTIDGQKRSLSLRDCLKQVLSNERDPIRRNIEYIEGLRDAAVHLIIGDIPRDVIGLSQACVINYHKCLNEWFSESLSERFPIGMMSIVYDTSPELSDLGDNRLRKRLGEDAATFLSRYGAELKREFDDLERSAEFSIGIDYHLVLTKKTNDADIVLSSGSSDTQPTQIIEIPKDPSTSHPFRQIEVVPLLTKRGLPVNVYDI